MMKFSTILVASVLLATFGSCDHSNANYCESKVNDDCRSDGGIGPIKGCKAAPEKCEGATAVCDVAQDVCVPCLQTNKQAAGCPAAAPVCASQTCGVCTADDQCDAGVCRADGTCAAENTVVYVSLTGAGAACTRIAPCILQTGLSQVAGPRSVLHLAAGTYQVMDGLVISQPTIVVGRGATVSRSTGTAGSTISTTVATEVEFLTVTGGLGNAGVGISSNGGSLQLTGVTVYGNAGGGISLTNSAFKLVNNVIVNNGGFNSTIGGIGFSNYLSGSAPALREMHFNTVVGNRAGTGLPSGISCTTVTALITTTSNIVYDNSVQATLTAANCVYDFSDMGPDVVVGNNNINIRPIFLNSNDFHLKNAAQNVGIANPTTANSPSANLATDIDGERRPQGNGNRDLGADEIP